MGINRADALVIFGATGDLARLETFPALVGLVARGVLDVPVIGVARSGWDAERFRRYAVDSLHQAGIDPDHKDSRRMLTLLRYVDGDLTDDATFDAVGKLLAGASRTVFYLEVPPVLFRPVVQALGRTRLARGARVMVEKPFGTDLRSARKLNAALHEVFPEESIYRVDHWLGLDPVQNLLFTRFGNTMLEPLLHRDHVASIQITMAEAFGVADRGAFYDRTGAVRDVVQNHMLQVLATVLMDPPGGGSGSSALRDERARAVRSLTPLSAKHAVLGQYHGYRQVPGVAGDSPVETFAAVRLHSDTWRWAGVPLLLRTGKRLPVTATEVTVRFRQPPRNVFDVPLEHNALRWRVWPESAITVRLNGKQPGGALAAQVDEARFIQAPGEDMRPYDRLIGAVLHGEHWMFAREDSVEAAWRIVDPVLRGDVPVHGYPPGSWGPPEAGALLPRGERWHDPA